MRNRLKGLLGGFGFVLNQKLFGTVHQVATPTVEEPIELRITVRSATFSQLARSMRAPIEGTITTSWAKRRPLQGEIALLTLDRRVIYDFTFEADDGRPRRFHGEVDFDPRTLSAIGTWLSIDGFAPLMDLTGKVFDEEREEARALLKIRRRDLFRTLTSLRPLR